MNFTTVYRYDEAFIHLMSSGLLSIRCCVQVWTYPKFIDLQVTSSVLKGIRYVDYRYISSVGRMFIYDHIKSSVHHTITDSHLFAKVNEDRSVWIPLVIRQQVFHLSFKSHGVLLHSFYATGH
jgi:hypothetical protein